MKKPIVIAALVLMLVSVAAVAAPKGELSYSAQTHLEIDFDKFTGIYNVSPYRNLLGSAMDRPRLSLTCQHDAGGKGIFLQVRIASKSWYFLSYGILLVNGVKYELPELDYFSDDVHREVVTGGINEDLFYRSGDPAVWAIIAAVKKAGVAGKVEYKFYGEKYSASGTMTEMEKQCWLDVLEYYDRVEVPRTF